MGLSLSRRFRSIALHGVHVQGPGATHIKYPFHNAGALLPAGQLVAAVLAVLVALDFFQRVSQAYSVDVMSEAREPRPQPRQGAGV